MAHRPVSGQTRNERMTSEKATRDLACAKDPIEKLRLMCLQRGASGILGFGKTFRRMDNNHSGDLTLAEFENGLADTGMNLSKDDIEILFNTFDRDGSGTIHYDEFLRSIRPPLNNNRLNVIDKAFAKLDKTGDGKVAMEDLKMAYNVQAHPEYQNGQKTQNELLQSFLAKFEAGGSIDGILTKEEFTDYYAGISASVDDDMYFDLMMRQAWKF